MRIVYERRIDDRTGITDSGSTPLASTNFKEETMILYVTGDLIQLVKDEKFDVIVHGCNCFCTMGSGVAAAIRKAFPAAYTVDSFTPYGEETKLGTISVADTGKVIVVNAYTQYSFGGAVRNFDYGAFQVCLQEIARRFGHLRIGMPKIGAGLGGGDWNKIKNIIHNVMGNCHSVTIVEYDQ